MAEDRSADQPKRLAYVVHPGSFATLALFDAARELCELVWVVHAEELDATELRLLARTGTVVDVEGLAMPEAAARVAAHDPDGILALADDKLRFTAGLAALLGLDFHTEAAAASLTDKLLQRQCLRAAGLATPRSWVVRRSDDVAMLDGELAFPVVLKPRLGEGSKDTISVGSIDELAAELARVQATGGEFVVEEYIADATSELGGAGFAGYVSVESCVDHGAIQHLAVTGRFPVAYPFRETGFFIPDDLDHGLRDDVRAVATAAVSAVGVTTGCLHTEIKLTDAGPVVIEVNGRIGGGVPELLDAAAHIKFLRCAMRLALGLDSGIPGSVAYERLAYLFYVHAPATIHEVTRVEGLEAVRSYPGVESVVLRNGPGSRVDWRAGNHGHVASVFGTTTDHAELRRVHAFVTETIEIDGA